MDVSAVWEEKEGGQWMTLTSTLRPFYALSFSLIHPGG